MSRGVLTAQLAVLVSEFKVGIAEFWQLTPRQVAEVYFHPRDKDGQLKPPKSRAEPDRLAMLMSVRAMAPMMANTPPEVIARLDAEIAAEWEKRRGAPTGRPD